MAPLEKYWISSPHFERVAMLKNVSRKNTVITPDLFGCPSADLDRVAKEAGLVGVWKPGMHPMAVKTYVHGVCSVQAAKKYMPRPYALDLEKEATLSVAVPKYLRKVAHRIYPHLVDTTDRPTQAS